MKYGNKIRVIELSERTSARIEYFYTPDQEEHKARYDKKASVFFEPQYAVTPTIEKITFLRAEYEAKATELTGNEYRALIAEIYDIPLVTFSEEEVRQDFEERFFG